MHKVIIFLRGGEYRCFIDVPLDECRKRDDEYLKSISHEQLLLERERKLHIIEYEFEDEFTIWTSVNKDIQDFVNIICQEGKVYN